MRCISSSDLRRASSAHANENGEPRCQVVRGIPAHTDERGRSVSALQIGIIFIWEWGLGSLVQVGLVLVEEGLVDGDFWWGESWGGNELEAWVADKLAGQPQEWLLEVVVGLGGDVVVLEVLLAVENDGLGLDLALLHVNLVTDEDDWDVLANADQITYRIVSCESHLKRTFGKYVRCQFGTFLYVMREVTSNMMIPHCPLM